VVEPIEWIKRAIDDGWATDDVLTEFMLGWHELAQNVARFGVESEDQAMGFFVRPWRNQRGQWHFEFLRTEFYVTATMRGSKYDSKYKVVKQLDDAEYIRFLRMQTYEFTRDALTDFDITDEDTSERIKARIAPHYAWTERDWLWYKDVRERIVKEINTRPLTPLERLMNRQ
jgi:hypothetical protein